jgi:hypothetical protein
VNAVVDAPGLAAQPKATRADAQVSDDVKPEGKSAEDATITRLAALDAKRLEQFGSVPFPEPARVGTNQEPIESRHANSGLLFA